MGRAAAERERLFMNELAHDRKWMVDFLTTMGWTLYQYLALYEDLASQGLIGSWELAKLLHELRRKCGDGLINKFGYLTQEGEEFATVVNDTEGFMQRERHVLGAYAAQRERKIMNELAEEPHDGNMMRDLRRKLVGPQEVFSWTYLEIDSGLEQFQQPIPPWTRAEFFSALGDLESEGLIVAVDEGARIERDTCWWEDGNLTYKGYHLVQKGEDFLKCGGDIRGKMAHAEGERWCIEVSGGKVTIRFLVSWRLKIHEGRRRRSGLMTGDPYGPYFDVVSNSEVESYYYYRAQVLTCELADGQFMEVAGLDTTQDIKIFGKVLGKSPLGDVTMKECRILGSEG